MMLNYDYKHFGIGQSKVATNGKNLVLGSLNAVAPPAPTFILLVLSEISLAVADIPKLIMYSNSVWKL